MLTQPRPSLSNVFLIEAACVAAAALYTIGDRSPPPLVSLFVAFAPIVAVGMWFQKYLRQANVALPFDFGYLFMLGWMVLIPVFAKRLPVQKPWRFAVMLYALGLAPVLIEFAINAVRVMTA